MALGAPFLYLPHCIASSVIVLVGVLVFGFWFHLSSFVNYFYSVDLCDSAFFAFLIFSLASLN